VSEYIASLPLLGERITLHSRPFVSDIAVFVLKRDVKLQPTNQANSASYPQRDRKWVPVKVRWRSAAGSKRRRGSFHLWINVLMAGKTVWSLVNTCHT